MQITGIIKLISNVNSYGSNGFRKRELIIQTEEQYPQTILIEFIQDKCEVLNSYNSGDTVTVSINLRGREWINPQGETKYFNSIQGWKIEQKNSNGTSTLHNPKSQPITTNFDNLPDDEDLPF